MAYARDLIKMDELLKKILENKNLNYEESFSLALKCSCLVNQKVTEPKGREVIVHVLDNIEKIDSGTYSIWNDLIESVGFYPYIDRISGIKLTFAEEVRKGAHLSENLSNVVFHKEQKKLWGYLASGKNVVASAPTSFGKSLLIEEIVASKKYKNIVIIQPTLALLDETRLKMRRYSTDYKIIVRTTQETSRGEKGNLFLLTAERVMEYLNLPDIDFLIIDEFYKLSLRRKDERADILNNAFLKVMKNKGCKFYFLGPNISAISDGFSKKYDAEFYKSDYSLVGCLVEDYSTKINWGNTRSKIDKEKQEKLFRLLNEFKDEQTLIYCSTPTRARRFAMAYFEYLKENGLERRKSLPLSEWIMENISPHWNLIDCLNSGIAVHDGSLPKHIGTSIINLFNSKELQYIFCTSTIIEGVNTSAKNVVIFDDMKGNKAIDFFDYSNIKGRSGRLMEHYVGKLYSFCRVPEEKDVIIDIPFFEQNPVSDEVLVNISKEDIKPENEERYKNLMKIEPDLLKIFKMNSVNIAGQQKILEKLMSDILDETCYSNTAWSGSIAKKSQMIYILSLGELGNIFSFEADTVVRSVAQLQVLISMYINERRMNSIIDNLYNYKINKRKRGANEAQQRKDYNESVENAFHVYRRWFQFVVPKTFRVVDNLQRYVCEKYNKEAGSYTYFCQQLENDFVRDNLGILTEYGIPSSATFKLESIISPYYTEDEVISFLKKNKKKVENQLNKYEFKKIYDSI